MIAEFQFGTPFMEPAVRESPVGEVTIEQLDAARSVPLRSVCWLEAEADAFAAALESDRTVENATHVVATDRGHQFEVKHDADGPGPEVYYTAIEKKGIFVSGTVREGQWELQMRFPDRSSFAEFRDTCDGNGTDISVQAIYEQEMPPCAPQYDLSDPQREILLLAVEKGYFDVPRRASLADLAEEVNVSSQAASERLRRGLDSLVAETLLTPE